MIYAWTQDQLKLLTYGSTVFCSLVNDRCVVIRVCDGGDVVALEPVARPGIIGHALLSDCDPSTIKPPSIGFIRELARERLGKDACAEENSWVSDTWRGYAIYLWWKPGIAGPLGHQLTILDERNGLDRYRAAVAAILALAGAGLGGGK